MHTLECRQAFVRNIIEFQNRIIGIKITLIIKFYDFGHGLTYSEIEEIWLDENTVEISNKGSFDTDYAVLKFEYIPRKNLCGFKKVHLTAGEKVIVQF